MRKSIGIVGARGHTGGELIALLATHPHFELAFVSSRERAGRRVADQVVDAPGALHYENLDAYAAAAKHVDAVVLALPNGHAAEWVAAFDQNSPDTVIVDLSADHRFDADWHYGLPELNRAHGGDRRRIANPGCYATAMQLALVPLVGGLAGPPQCFGVSGWSGAGTAPSERNDPAKLRDNLMPYQLVGHVHEREVGHRLGVPVEFLPHVASHFRGIMLTLNLCLREAYTVAAARTRYRDFYAAEPLVHVADDAPWVGRIAGRHHVEIGGFAVAHGGRRLVLVATIDNLLKGAATQAVQNLNLALGFDELAGIPWRTS
jgi:N-acetyl-gamma-glutamyl-phosphate reductase